MQIGTCDLFLSDAARLHRVLRRAAVPVEFYLGEGMPHGGFTGGGARQRMKNYCKRSKSSSRHVG
nr:hypothetical protein [Pseudomonas sp. G5001]